MLIVAQTSYTLIVLGLLGGLALFLLGMNILTDALTSVAGDKMRDLLARLTGNRFAAAISGTIVTAVTQSSSVTTVLLVGFVSAGLMNASQCFGVIIGANIGSTFTAQIIAFNVTAYAPLLLAAGVFTQMIARRQKVRHYAGVVLGLGLVFTGMAVMSEATYPLRENPAFVEAMKSMETAALGILVGAVFTAIVQSSGATTGLIIVLASQGFISLEAGIALALGANIGTCVTAILAAIGKPRAAWQVATMHILFNVIGVIVWLAFIDQLALMVRAISPEATNLQGVQRVAAEAPRQIANAHTLFNVINAGFFLIVTGWMVRLAQWLVPIRTDEQDTGVKPRFITSQSLAMPAISLDYTRLELERIARRVQAMFDCLPQLIAQGDEQAQKSIHKLSDETELLYGHVVTHLSKLSQADLAQPDSDRLQALLSVGNHLRDLAEIIRDDLAVLGTDRQHSNKFEPSEETEQHFKHVHAQIASALGLIIDALHSGDRKPAQQVVDMKKQVYQDLDDLGRHLARRLAADEPDRLTHYRVESDIREQLKRCYYLIRRIGKRLASTKDA